MVDIYEIPKRYIIVISPNSPCSKRGENWVQVGTTKHLWIDWKDSRFVNNMAESAYVHPINP